MALSLNQKHLLGFARVTLGTTMLLAATAKVVGTKDLIATINSSSIVPPNQAVLVANMLIIAEFLVALSMLIHSLNTIGFYLSAMLSSLFFSFSIWRGYQGIKVPCSCFGALFKLAPWQTGILSLFLCSLAFQALKCATKNSNS